MLSARGLSKSYGAMKALDRADLDIAPGEICGLLGANGAGKTTLVSIVAGLRRADAGSVTIDGIDSFAHPLAARRRLGLAPQELGVYLTLSVRENLVFFGELADLRGRLLSQRIDEAAHAFALTELMDRPVRELSGGEKRRLHTAVATLHRPPLLLLDEPTSGVDVQTRAGILAVVRRLAADGSAVCYSTHYLPEVEALGASVVIIDGGRVIARGSVDDLIRRHGGRAVELRFDGTPPPIATACRVETADHTVRIYSDDPAAEAALALAGLGPGALRPKEIEIISPSLESVFLALTGRRYTPDGVGGDERGRVVSS
jgi:ABC-2 type transport system ATP-binding protein